ncbi:hypothetical protein LEUCIP111803_01874 [Leucobacter soli]|uniref:Uncharacterized protein n=1 Tax=Leucobacter soli TaxID=2812850 RepID=A0A916NIB1_9MICO|nr:hypothetical protein LEUCIP111803_01874 [Leucobacter soli]
MSGRLGRISAEAFVVVVALSCATAREISSSKSPFSSGEPAGLEEPTVRTVGSSNTDTWSSSGVMSGKE